MRTTLMLLLILCVCWGVPVAEGSVVSGVVRADGSPHANITVDVWATGVFESTMSGADGEYELIVPEGTAEVVVEIVTPLGYDPLSPASGKATVSVPADDVDFEITWVAGDPGEARGLGYWKHQIAALSLGRGHAQESFDDLDAYWDNLHTFNDPAHGIDIFGLYGPNSEGYQGLQEIFFLHAIYSWGPETMWERAYLQLTALFLNTLSYRLQQDEVISADGATVSQALQQVAAQVDDGDPSNDEAAKDVADRINSGRDVPAGAVDISLPVILYGAPGGPSRPSPALSSFRVTPNPMVRSSTLDFELASPGNTTVRIFDVAGRLMRTLLDEELPSGRHSTAWDGRSNRGEVVASGVYFYQIDGPGGQLVARFVVMH